MREMAKVKTHVECHQPAAVNWRPLIRQVASRYGKNNHPEARHQFSHLDQSRIYGHIALREASKAQLWDKQGCGNGRVHAYTNNIGPCRHARHAFQMITVTTRSNCCDEFPVTFRIATWCSKHGPSSLKVHRHHLRLLKSDIRRNITAETWSSIRAPPKASRSIAVLRLLSRILPKSPTPSKQIRRN